MRQSILFVLIVLLLTGCVHHIPVTSQMPTATPGVIVVKPAARSGPEKRSAAPEDDPAAYCLVVNDPEPGVSMLTEFPEEAARKIMDALSITDERKETAVIGRRCMNKEVLFCDLHQNPDCLERISYIIDANEAMREVCADSSLDGAILPPSLTGTNNAFSWQCQDGKPVISGQVLHSDELGYDTGQWVKVSGL